MDTKISNIREAKEYLEAVEHPILRKSNLLEAYEKSFQYDTDEFNCWGASLYLLGEADELYWADGWEMTDFLKNNTKKINPKDLKTGDILVLWENIWNGEKLCHTAVYIEGSLYFHKMGSGRSEFATMSKILDTYSEYSRYEIRRLKK